MKGFAMLEIGKTGWIEKERPKCGPLDAIIKPLALSPCTSDIHTVWEGALGDRHNMILGHEGCGVVEEVGELVKDFKVGDRVMVAAITPDWSSLEAQGGYPMHSGGMLSDMVPTGFHGVELADIQFGDTVLVNGIGPVGLMSVAGANLRGASRIICVGTRPACREAAKKYGATDFISYKEGSIDEQVLELTGGKGVDKAIVAGGGVESFDPIIKALKPGGKIGNVNYLGSGTYVTIPRVEWGCGMGHKMITGGLMPGGRLRLEKLASLIEVGKLDVRHLITHRFDGFEHVEDALMLMKDKPADLIKPVVNIGK
jgi:NADP-dependent alcohol dehydrogenase